MIVKIKKDVLKKFKNNEKRLNHILGVHDMSLAIAKKLGLDTEKISIAALFHDYMKDEPVEGLKKTITPYTYKRYKDVPEAYHAFSAATILETDYDYHDADVIEAIKYHVTAKKSMSLLAKILFVCDYSEPNRTHMYADEVRELAYQDIEKAYALALKKKIEHIESKGNIVDKNQYEALESIKKAKDSLLDIIMDELDGLKVKDLAVYDFEATSPFYDYFVIATVNDRQGQAAITHIKKAIGDNLRHIENSKGWVLIDASSVIIHLFKEEDREYYGFDKRLLGVKRVK